MLYIHSSNQLETLKNQYASVVSQPLYDVFKSETVVVQNAGMARWLSMEMANVSGISANTEFLFPAEFMWRLLRIVSPDIPEHSQCAPDTLRFHIFDELLTNPNDYSELHHYIFEQKNQNTIDKNRIINNINAWELSCQLAQLLDQYLFYRSDWISAWEASNWDYSEHWQSRLWNRCVKDKCLLHWLALQDQFSENIDTLDITHVDNNTKTKHFAERISFFSMAALSPSYVDLLGKVADKIDIHIFIINPCEDIYWGDIQSPKRHAKLALEQQNYTDIGNPLLASLGNQGRDFIAKLIDIPNAVSNLENIHSYKDSNNYNVADDSDKNTQIPLLECVQMDINHLAQPSFRKHLQAANHNILIHACHTPMREVEVLYDQLLRQLDDNSDLAPSDIVVMMPDIELYAPYIDAVFGSTIGEKTQEKNATQQRLPFSIADRDPQNIFSVIQALDKLFSLPETRFEVESVFELLEYEDIRKHFNLDEAHVAYCRELAKSTNIRWGISAKTRALDNLPANDEHTWQYALNRMLLGYALADNGSTLFDSPMGLDLLAYSEIEGNNALIYANFNTFVDTVFSINDWLKQRHHLKKWISKTTVLIQKISPENSDQQRIFKALSDLELKANLADFNHSLSFDVYHNMFQECLSGISANEKYLGYGITFCALVPMRSVPFKVVALLGLNDGEFPRQDTRLSFDLTKNALRKGDRSRRDEDRYLFLESILAARDTLIISYIGQSIKDNTELPPSILVSELIDTLNITTGNDFSEQIIKHPLQAFSNRYFTSEKHNDDVETNENTLFSYAQHFTQLSLNKENQSSESFITKSLTELENDYKNIALDELIRFYQNPSNTFLKQRFNVQTYNENNELETREPFALESFKDRELRHLILKEIAMEKGDEDQQDLYLIARAKGLLPYGQIGDDIVQKERHIMDAFMDKVPESDDLSERTISVEVGGFKLSGNITRLNEQGRLLVNVSTPYFSDYMSLWLEHLLLNVSDKDDSIGKRTVFYSPDISFQFNEVDKPKQHLETLLRYYWQGLHFPLPFFPKTSFSLFNHPLINNKEGENFGACDTRWNGNEFVAGEKFRFENWLLHRELNISKDIQPDDFMNVSRDCLAPLFNHLSVIS